LNDEQKGAKKTIKALNIEPMVRYFIFFLGVLKFCRTFSPENETVRIN